jgi:hypothetical protein
MTPEVRTDVTQGEELLEKRRRARKRAIVAERIWFAVLAGFAVIVALGAGIVLFSAYPGSCAVCHGEITESLEGNAHAELRCEGCHAGTTIVGILQSRMAVIDMTLYTLAPIRTPVIANAASELCIDCHEQGLPLTVTVEGLRMNHRAPAEAGWECRTCHPGSGHEVRVALGGYTMDMCLGCHSADAVNLTTCEVCHVDEAGTRSATRETRSPWRITHGPNWQSAHGMGDLGTCGSCHGPRYCVRCHGENVPHPAKYLAQHGQDVMARTDGKDQCLTCHLDSGCFDCHGLEMPHPTGFLQSHADDIRDSDIDLGEACARCHQQRSCDNCHVQHTHPGLTQERIDELRSRPVRVR